VEPVQGADRDHALPSQSALAGENQKLAKVIHFADIVIRAMRFGNGGTTAFPSSAKPRGKSLDFSTPISTISSYRLMRDRKSHGVPDFIK